MTSESVSENSFGLWLKEQRGGNHYFKLSFIGRVGAPDRLILGKGFFYMIEWKAKGKEITKMQRYIHAILIRAGIHVHVCISVEQAVEIHTMEKNIAILSSR